MRATQPKTDTNHHISVSSPLKPLLHTRAEAAKLLAICLRSVDKLIDTGELDIIYVGRSVRITHESLLRFIERQRTKHEGRQ